MKRDKRMSFTEREIQILWAACQMHIFVRCFPQVPDDRREEIIRMGDRIGKQFPKVIEKIPKDIRS